MSYTKEYTVDQDAWVEVASGVSAAFVQLKEPGPVLVHVGQSTPDAGSQDGILLNDPGLVEINITGMESGDVVYARSLLDETNKVVASAQGEAPSEAV